MKRLNQSLLVLGFVFLVVLLCKIGLRELGQELARVGLGLVPVILAEGVAELFHAVGWRYCLGAPYRSVPLWRLFRINMSGYAMAYLTPTASLGGDLTKVSLLTSIRKGPEAVTGVLVGKVSFAVAHLLFVVGGMALVLQQLALPRALTTVLLLSAGIWGVGIIAFLIIQRRGKLGVPIKWLAKRNLRSRMLQKLSARLNLVDDSLKLFYRQNVWALPVSVLWHFLGYAVGIFQTWYFLELLTPDPSLISAATTWVIGLWFDLLTFAVPLNLGTMEGSRVVALAAIGCNSLLGVTYGLVLRIAQLFWAGFGLVNYAMLTRGKIDESRTASSEIAQLVPSVAESAAGTFDTQSVKMAEDRDHSRSPTKS